VLALAEKCAFKGLVHIVLKMKPDNNLNKNQFSVITALFLICQDIHGQVMSEKQACLGRSH